MVEKDPSYTAFPSNYKDIFHPENDTYEHTTLPTGFGIEILKTLAEVHNFTFTYYTRKDGVWGSTDKDGNPTGLMEFHFYDHSTTCGLLLRNACKPGKWFG